MNRQRVIAIVGIILASTLLIDAADVWARARGGGSGHADECAGAAGGDGAAATELAKVLRHWRARAITLGV